MLNWIKQLHLENRYMLYFILANIIWMVVVILSMIYPYARLDYVRSYKVPSESNNPKPQTYDSNAPKT